MNHSRWLLALVLSVPGAPLTASAARHEPGEVLVITRPTSPLVLAKDGSLVARDPRLSGALARHGLGRYVALGAERPGRGRILRLRSDRADFDPVAAAAELGASGAFRAAAPNLMLDLFVTNPNDLYVPYQWHLKSSANYGASLPAAWDLGKGDTSTVIAIMDNGLDIGHPDLAAQVWINRAEVPANGLDDDGNGYADDVLGWDFGNGDSDPSSEPAFDPSGIDVGFHGTFVAGVAAAATNNSIGIAGAGWRCRFMALKVGNSAGDLPLSAVTEAFAYVTDQGAAVLNLSLGTADPTGQAFFQVLVDDANDAGILCVAAAGNSNVSTPHWPAACDGVLSVGATTVGNARASFSNFGTWVDIAAPGETIWSSICRNYEFDEFSQIIYLFYFGWDGSDPYMYGDGTSFASPLVAGIAGLLRAQRPLLTPAQVAQHLVNTGDVVAYDQPIGPRVNAYNALHQGSVAVAPGSDPRLEMRGPWPNPFATATSIGFDLAGPSRVRLSMYDSSGRRVRALLDAELPAGPHTARWDGAGDGGTRLGTGIYFAALEIGGRHAFAKLVLIP